MAVMVSAKCIVRLRKIRIELQSPPIKFRRLVFVSKPFNARSKILVALCRRTRRVCKSRITESGFVRFPCLFLLIERRMPIADRVMKAANLIATRFEPGLEVG